MTLVKMQWKGRVLWSPLPDLNRGLEKTLSWQSENAEAFQRQHHAQGSKQEHHHDVEDGALGLRNPTPALVGPVLPPKPAFDHHREHQVGKASQPGCQGSYSMAMLCSPPVRALF